jgi:hypothetical protein
MDIALIIVRAIVHLVILCVRCFRSRSREQKKSYRIPTKKAQDAHWAWWPRRALDFLAREEAAVGRKDFIYLYSMLVTNAPILN